MSTTTAATLLEETRAARRAGDVRRCARMAEAAVDASGAENDAHSAFHALTAVGMLHLSRAEPAQAAPYFAGALDVAHRGDLLTWLAPCYHNLYVAHRDAGDPATGLRYARTALELHADRKEGHRVALLVADMQEGSLTLRPTPEKAKAALNCWRSVSFSASTPRERMLVRVNAMDAAAVLSCYTGCERYRKLFFEAADGFQGALNECADAGEGEDVARCLTEASVAAARMEDFERAARLACDGLRIAASRNEDVIAQMAGEARIAAVAERAPEALWD